MGQMKKNRGFQVGTGEGWFCWEIEVFRKNGGFVDKKRGRKRGKGGENRGKNGKKCGF